MTLLTDMQQEANVIMNEGVSNQEISDTMYDLLEEIDDDLNYLYDAEDKEEEDIL